MTSFAQFARFNTGQVGVRNSVMNPLLWLAGPMAALFLTAAFLMPDYRGILICLSFLPCVAVLIAYLAFAIFDPDRLQSEEYQLHTQKMQMMQGQEEPVSFLLDDNVVPNISASTNGEPQ